jgi:phage recombination protein Bet
MNEIAKVDAPDLALIKRTVAPGATNDELALFIRDCERRGVHPLDKLIVFTKAGGKYSPITTIDYMRSRAAESGEMAGSDDARFSGEGKQLTATVTVYRLTNGTRYGYTATARLAEYYRNTPTWNHMAHTMTAKCAEALALRKAFPAELAGLYTRDEMQQAGVEEAPDNEKIEPDQHPKEIEQHDRPPALLLADAAEQGTEQLQKVWGTLSREEKENNKIALDTRFKPRAVEVDAMIADNA